MSRTSPQNNSEGYISKHDKHISKERYTSPKERHRVIDDLTLVQQYNNGISKINKLVKSN